LYLFSYGSNHPAQLAERLGHPIVPLPAFAEGWHRVFRGHSRTWGGAGVASLERAPGGVTFGSACLVTPADLSVMDGYEGVPFAYQRHKIKIRIGSETRPRQAVVYLAVSREFNPPSRSYLQAIARTVSTHWRRDDGSPVRPEDFPIR
jgi:gamma-glutamylcyclotransferase